MIKRVGFLTLLIAASFGAARSKADVYEQLQTQRLDVLGGHVFSITQARLNGLKSPACVSFSNTLKEKINTLGNSRPRTADEVAAWTSLYLDSQTIAGKCGNALNQSELSLQKADRKKFRALSMVSVAMCASAGAGLAPVCLQALKKIIVDLDPHCATPVSKSLTGNQSTNSCYAADHMIARSLRERQDPRLTELKTFGDRLSEAIRLAPQATARLDVWSVFLNGRPDTPALREKLLAILSMAETSSRSASDHVDGFAEYYWTEALKETKSPIAAITEYHRIKMTSDRIHTLINWARSEKIELTIRGRSLVGTNRHDLMAAYLGCHYRNDGKMYRAALPRLLGRGYELLDFKSHLEEKWTLKEATENFKRDSGRYRTGAKWGYEFCLG